MSVPARRSTARACVVLIISALVAACRSSAPNDVRIVVDTTTHYQTMSGWEATAQSGHESAEYPLYRDSLLTLAASDLGVNRLRLEVRSGVEHTRDYWSEGRANRLRGNAFRCARYETVNDNADPHVIAWKGFHFSELDYTVENLVLPFQRAVAASGTRMVLEVTYVAFFNQCPQGRRYDHRDPEEYAEFVLATALHLRERYGLLPDLWEIILEPDNTDDWSGTLVGRAITLSAARLREHGFVFRFVAPSDKSMTAAVRDYDALRAVPGARAEVAELSYHRYRGVTSDALRSIAERGLRDGVRTAMLEHIGSGVDDLIEDLTVGNVSAWSQYAMAYATDTDRGGLYYRIDLAGPKPRVVEGTRTRFIRQVFRAARLGAVRIRATTDSPNAAPVAFHNPGGAIGLAVRTKRATRLTVSGLPAGRYALTYATTDSAHAALPDVDVATGAPMSATIPAAGVLTVLAR